MKVPHHIIGFVSLLIMFAGMVFLSPTGHSQVSDPGTDSLQDMSISAATSAPESNPSAEADQNGPSSPTSNPSTDLQQDGPAGLTSNPSGDLQQDGPAGITPAPTSTPTSTPPVTEPVPPTPPTGGGGSIGGGGGGGGSGSASAPILFPAVASPANANPVIIPAPIRTTRAALSSSVIAATTSTSTIASTERPPLFDIVSSPLEPSGWSIIPYLIWLIILLILIILLLLYIKRRIRLHLLQNQKAREIAAMNNVKKMPRPAAPNVVDTPNPYLDKMFKSEPTPAK